MDIKRVKMMLFGIAIILFSIAYVSLSIWSIIDFIIPFIPFIGLAICGLACFLPKDKYENNKLGCPMKEDE